jgi:Glycosyl hydrolase family 26
MTHLKATTGSRPSLLRRRPIQIASAVIAVALASCSSSKPSSSPTSSPSPRITVAAQVPSPPTPCAVSANLVNSCGPWLGAAANGNPAAPHGAVGQFLYLERLLGHHLSIFRDYNNAKGMGPTGMLPLNPDELYFAKQPDTYLDVNWKPATTWAAADGGDATVNAKIKKVADSIRSIAPHKLFLTVWVEPQSAVSGGTDCPGVSGTAGTPAQYKQMWQNVENIFKAQHVHNVIWTMDYMSFPKWDCLVTQLWPGNNLVDWVLYDTYDHDTLAGSNFTNTAGTFYQLLENDSSPSVDFDAKPWGLGEFNTCANRSSANTLAYFQQARQAIEDNTYPRLHMFNIFADTGGGTASQGCLTDYTPNGQQDASKNSAIKSLANSPVFNR